MTPPLEERRDERLTALEARMLDLERSHGKLYTTVCVTEAKVEGLVQTIKSRFDAFDKGQDLILERLKPLDILAGQKLHTRLEDLESIRDKAEGAVWLVRVLGITGIIGGLVAIIRMIRG